MLYILQIWTRVSFQWPEIHHSVRFGSYKILRKNLLIIILFLSCLFRCRSLQWVLSCATSIQCCYLSSYIWWSWEGQSSCNCSSSSRNISKSKNISPWVTFYELICIINNSKNSSWYLSICSLNFFFLSFCCCCYFLYCCAIAVKSLGIIICLGFPKKCFKGVPVLSPAIFGLAVQAAITIGTTPVILMRVWGGGHVM